MINININNIITGDARPFQSLLNSEDVSDITSEMNNRLNNFLSGDNAFLNGQMLKSVPTTALEDNAITTDKIKNEAVTSNKLADGLTLVSPSFSSLNTIKFSDGSSISNINFYSNDTLFLEATRVEIDRGDNGKLNLSDIFGKNLNQIIIKSSTSESLPTGGILTIEV